MCDISRIFSGYLMDGSASSEEKRIQAADEALGFSGTVFQIGRFI